jgi:hypothetical protein
LKQLLEAAGFAEVAFSDRRYDTFSDAPSASSAAEFGTEGVDIFAVKPRERVGANRPTKETAIES